MATLPDATRSGAVNSETVFPDESSFEPKTPAPESSLFTYQSRTRGTDGGDIATMMAAVFEQSRQLRPRRVRHTPLWTRPSLAAEAALGREILAEWRDAAIASTTAFLGRHPRSRKVAARLYLAAEASLAHARSILHLVRTRPAVMKPLMWAGAGLLLGSVIYTAWPSTKHPTTTTPPAARQITASTNPAPSTPTPTPAAVQAAPAIPTASANRARAVANPTRLTPASQPLGYVGSLLVTSEPQGAEVWVDGVLHGRTPLTITNVSIGSRVVRLDLPGHQRWTWAVSVVANKQTPIAVILLPVTPATGDGEVSGPKRF